ncbi:MAG: hypothetical protein ACI9FN_003842 [Saprospiraceae bacterium]|jgi:hypothetical protein
MEFGDILYGDGHLFLPYKFYKGMCAEKILYQGETILISKAAACDCINLTLPNVNIHFKHQEFTDFADYINHLNHSEVSKSGKFIHVATPLDGLTLYFRKKEFALLCKALHRAIVTLRLPQLEFNASASLN